MGGEGVVVGEFYGYGACGGRREPVGLVQRCEFVEFGGGVLVQLRAGSRDVVAAATPITMPAVETIPSLAPKTPARSQFSLEDAEPVCGSG